MRQLVKRIQILVLLFIEGGSYIGEDAEGNDDPESSLARWSVYFVYKKSSDAASRKAKYIFQGYSTVYHFWMFQQPTPPATPNESWELPEGEFSLMSLPHRARISQFIILPPFQGKGIGAVLYNTLFAIESGDSSAKEVTVEDPNEAFDLLRDICDMRYLRRNEPEFASLKINPNVPVPEKGGILYNDTEVSLAREPSPEGNKIVNMDALEKLRAKHKIAPRQFFRLVEMHLMSQLPASVRPQADASDSKKPAASREDKHVYTLWRLLLKQRLYRRNATILGEFEITERIIKLNDTVDNVEWEYASILERVEHKPIIANGKRKQDEGTAEDGPSGKKARFSDA